MLIDFSLDCIETKYVTFNYKYIDYDFMISFNFFFKKCYEILHVVQAFYYAIVQRFFWIVYKQAQIPKIDPSNVDSLLGMVFYEWIS